MIRRLLPFIALIVVGLVVASFFTAHTQTPGGFFMSDNVSLTRGNHYDGNMIAFVREFKLEEDSHVSGNVTVFSQGEVFLDGEIDGNLQVVGANVTLGSNLTVHGNVTLCSSNVKRAEDAHVEGTVSTGCNFTDALKAPAQNGTKWAWFERALANPVFHFLEIVGSALGVAALAGLVAVLLPRRLRRARDAAMSAPVTAGIAGFVTLVIAIGLTFVYGLSLLLIITLVLLPVVGLAWLGLTVMLFAGWVVVSEPIGRIILSRLNISTVPMVASVVGAFALTLSTQLFSLIPCLSLISVILSVTFSSIGLGALLLTRGGRRSYPSLTVRRIEVI